LKDLSKKTNNQLWKLWRLLQKATELSYDRYLQTEKARYLRIGEGFLLAQITIDREFQNRRDEN